MAINVKELTKNKSMRMSDEDITKTVSKYMMKITLERLESTVMALSQISDVLPNYVSKKIEKEEIDPNLSPKNNVRQYGKDYNTNDIGYEFNLHNINYSSGAFAA
ncbi:hypothetical protein KQ236_07790 [Lactococcus lactis]|nr:hypothetical protein [Lactococcus lactis]